MAGVDTGAAGEVVRDETGVAVEVADARVAVELFGRVTGTCGRVAAEEATGREGAIVMDPAGLVGLPTLICLHCKNYY